MYISLFLVTASKLCWFFQLYMRAFYQLGFPMRL